VVFPKEYKEFLMKFGAALAEGFEIFGLPGVPKGELSLWEDVVFVNQELRRGGQAGSERPGYIAISEDGTGVYFFLDTKSPETRIIAEGVGLDATVVAHSLLDFVVGFSEGTIGI
jgi:hypothetical protein